MPGITLDDVKSDEDFKPIENGQTEVDEVEQTEIGGFHFGIPEFLKAKSPDEPIENFINHPFNFDGSRGLAQIIKGLTGMFGYFNYAIIDIVMGWLRWTKERKEDRVVTN